MAEKDVSLVIKAKESAKKAVDAVTDALGHLTDAQKDASQGASKATGLFGKLQDEIGNLERQAKALTAFNKIAVNMERAAEAVGVLDASSKRAVAAEKELAAAADAAAAKTKAQQQILEVLTEARDRQRAAVTALSKEQKKNNDLADAERAKRDQLNAAVNRQEKAVKAAISVENALTSAFVKSANAADAETLAFNTANDELMQIAEIANRASSALGGVAATQEAVAAASVKAAADLARMQALLGKQTTTRATTASPDALTRAGAGAVAQSTAAYREQQAAVAAAKNEWLSAQAAATTLGQAISKTEAATFDQEQEFLHARIAAKLAKEEYLAQGVALNKLRASLIATRAAGRPSGTQPAGGTVDPQYTQYTEVTRGVNGANKTATSSTYSLRDAFKSLYGESRQAMNLFQRLRGEVYSLAGSFVGLYAAVNGIVSVVKTYIGLQSVQARLGVVFQQDTNKTAAEVAWLREQADRLGISFGTLSDEYGKFAVAAQAANFTNAQTRKTFLAVAESARVMNLSADETQGIFKALTQMMSKGKVQAEELRGQLGERMSGAFQIFAQAIGVSTAQLDKMLVAGEVVANQSTLLAFADKLNERFGPQLAKSLESTSTGLGKLSNDIQVAQVRIGNAGFITSLNVALAELDKWFKTEDANKFFDGIGAALGHLVELLPPLVQNFDKIAFLFQVIAALKVGQIFIGLVGGMKGFDVATRAATLDVARLVAGLQVMGAVQGGASGAIKQGLAATLVNFRGVAIAAAAGVRALWAAIGGWPGLIITAATYAISAFAGQWITSVDNASKIMNEHERIVEKVKNGYIEAANKAEDWAKKIEGVTLSQAQANLNDLNKMLIKNQEEAAKTGDAYDFLSTRIGQKARIPDDIVQSYANLSYQWQNGKITADAYKEGLDQIARALPPGTENTQRFLLKQQELADKARDTEKSIREAGAVIDVLTGQAKGATAAALGLDNAMAGLNATAHDTSGIDAYTAALTKLRGGVPTLKAVDDKAAAIKEANDTYDQAAALFRKKRPRGQGGGALAGDAGAADKLAALAAARDARLAAIDKEYNKKIDPPAKKVAKTDAQKKAEKQKEFDASIIADNLQRQQSVEMAGELTREQAISLEIEKAKAKALKDNLTISDDQIKSIRTSVGAQYDQQLADKTRKKIVEETAKLLDAQGSIESRNAFIAREMGLKNLDNLTEEQKQLAIILGQEYDIEESKRRQAVLDNNVSTLEAQAASLQAQIETATNLGQSSTAEALYAQLVLVNAELAKAVQASIDFYKALDPATNPNAAATIAALEAQKAGIQAFGAAAKITKKDIDDMLMSGASTALDNFAEAIANGENAVKSLGDAFRQFASDFLRQIAQMILKQLLLNALQTLKPGGGIGGKIASVISAAVKHDGGTVGEVSGRRRSVMASAFANAQRYHGGGIVGLKPNERPIIAQVGEGIFTEEEMKGMAKGGGPGGGAGINLKNINLFDVASLAKAMMADEAGQKAFINMIGENSSAVNTALRK